MNNPFFYLFDGVLFGLKWIGDNFGHVMAFLASLFVWYIAWICQLIVATGPSQGRGDWFEPWMEWTALGISVFLAINIFGWSRLRFNDQYKQELGRHVITGMLSGAVIFNFTLVFLSIMYG